METYTREQALEKSIEYFNGDELAADVFVKKYALSDGDKFYELTPDDMHKRLAKEFSRIEKKYPNPLSENEIYEYLKNFKYIVPQGSPMSAIGNDMQIQSISNCFVIPSPYDSYGGILKTDQELVQISKRRGGVGFDISTIRPRGTRTNNAAKTTDGIGVFMERYSNSTREVAQNGRRGALMLTLSVHHPEILTFVKIKQDLKKITGANISVKLSDEFMNAVENDEEYELRWPVDKTEVVVINEKISARLVWDEIIKSAHGSAEPGILFWDTAKKMTPADIYEDDGFGSISTNPCGEIILSPYDSCRLLLVNLISFVENPFTKDAYFDFEKYSQVTMSAQRLMDDMIDLELEKIQNIIMKIDKDPEPSNIKRIELDLWENIKDACINGRRTGLGITAIGDMLAALGIQYGSEKSISVVEEVYKNLCISSYTMSIKMAAERGPFPVFDVKKEKGHPFVDRVLEHLPKDIVGIYKKFGRRNIANTTTAPAGSVSCLTQTTSGIEPAYLLEYTRRRKLMHNEDVVPDYVDPVGDRWVEYKVYHHQYKKWMEISGCEEIEKSPYHKSTSNDIDWTNKVRMQAAAQKWVCHAISNTTNVPNDTSIDTIKEIYMTGWKTGCKGITVYRDGCRSGVLVKKEDKPKKGTIEYRSAPKRLEVLPCDIHRVNIKGEEWTIFVGILNGDPFEVFGGLSDSIEIPKKYKDGRIKKRYFKSGGKYDLYVGEGEEELKIKDIVKVFDNPNHSAFTRLLSLSMRHGAPTVYVVEQLLRDPENDMHSFSKVMARVLKKYIADGEKRDRICPECGGNDMSYQEGCLTCMGCGYAKCG